MEKAEELKRIIDSGKSTYTIDEIYNLYGEFNVNIENETIIAKYNNLTHLYNRNSKIKKTVLCKDFLPYEQNLYKIKSHEYYPIDLCNVILYDENINRYAQGIVIPRINKFVIIDDFNLVRIPEVKSFYTTCIDENNKIGRKLTDTIGNIYEIDKCEDDFSFNVMTQFEQNSLMHKFCGFVISYKGKPVYAETCQPPYIILNKELFFMYCGNFHVNNRGRNFLQDLNMDNFDDNFMLGYSYTKKL